MKEYEKEIKRIDDKYNEMIAEYQKIREEAAPDSEEYKDATQKGTRLLRKRINEIIVFINSSKIGDTLSSKETATLIELSSADFFIPNKYVSPINKEANEMFDNKMAWYEKVNVRLAQKGKEIKSTLTLDWDSIESDEKLTFAPYDREVHDSVITLFNDGRNRYMTRQMIYRMITKNKESRLTENASASNEIDKSMIRLNRLMATFEASKEEMEAWPIKEGNSLDLFSVKDSVINWRLITARINGEVNEVYEIMNEPILYTKAKQRGQVRRTPLEYLDTPIYKNKENIILQSFLYRRICLIQGNKENDNRNSIPYESIYEHLELSAPNENALKNKKFRVRKNTKKILDYWKKEKLIKGYEEKRKDGSIYNVQIKP